MARPNMKNSPLSIKIIWWPLFTIFRPKPPWNHTAMIGLSAVFASLPFVLVTLPITLPLAGIRWIYEEFFKRNA